jgi:type II restriction/modification system DNA methylase subunit YeeA
MNIAQIENNLQLLVNSFDENSFIYELLLAYGQPKASIKRLQEGGLNLSKNEGDLLWKKKIFFKETSDTDLHDLIDDLRIDDRITKHSPRFIIVTDYKNLLARDTKTADTLDIEILEIPRYFDFFLPLAGMEKAQHQFENPADVRAAERMGKLYDEIKKDNSTDTEEEVHNLNVFLTRLLFCFFAEDTNIFDKSQFTHSLINHTQEDGSDLHTHFERLFLVMNTPDNLRGNIPEFLNSFPYVNGGLFRNQHNIPQFSRKSRTAIIESGELDWSAINPDIFGSMIQAVITPEHRGGLGMHYTSVPNIMKVIEPLFLNDFYEEFESSKGNSKRLRQLLNRIWNTKYFDPASGSGNFLIITYKELRKLEMKIFKELNEMALSNIRLNQFYGIELDDFAHEVAILSLWLAEHQMNQIFFKEFGRSKPALPLSSAGNIVHGNALRLNWEKVCPKSDRNEIYLMGNPPYLGSKNLSQKQRDDMDLVFNKRGKTLDYIAAWFQLASNYIQNSLSKYSFVSTNSICQGEQVYELWKGILIDKEIFFAHTSFKWANNAKNKAGVSVVIVGIQNKNTGKKKLFTENHIRIVENINPYLISGKTIFIESRNQPLSKIEEMIGGNVAYDSGHLIFEEHEMLDFVKNNFGTEKFFRKIIGGKELLNGTIRYCLWLKDYQIKDLQQFEGVITRVNKVKESRLAAKDEGTHKLAQRPHQFRDLNNPLNYIALPKTSSERRTYIPVAYFDDTIIPIDSVRIIPDAEPYLFAIVSSRMHMVWIKTVSGKLEDRYRYSKNISYNTFPFPLINENTKDELAGHAYRVLTERETYSERNLAQLYDPDKMPKSLRDAHHQLDLAVERCYRSKPFESNEERLEYLFKLYEQMIEEEKSIGTLFEMESKPKKKKK